MSELLENIELFVDEAQVVANPLDATLTVSGAAADAKAVGDRFAGIESLTAETINMNSASPTQTIAQAMTSLSERTSENIPYLSTDTTTVAEMLSSLTAKTAIDIMIEPSSQASVADRISELEDKTATDIPLSDEDSTTVAQKVSEIDSKTAQDILIESGEESTVASVLSDYEDRIETLENVITAEQIADVIEEVFP